MALAGHGGRSRRRMRVRAVLDGALLISFTFTFGVVLEEEMPGHLG
jgi:hypothetical protein